VNNVPINQQRIRPVSFMSNELSLLKKYLYSVHKRPVHGYGSNLPKLSTKLSLDSFPTSIYVAGVYQANNWNS